MASVNAAASAYVKQTTEKIGLDAGVNLHDDTLLQKKEIDRTKFLGYYSHLCKLYVIALDYSVQGRATTQQSIVIFVPYKHICNGHRKVDPPSTMLVNPKVTNKKTVKMGYVVYFDQ